jgi:hypothetical protein
MTQINFNAFDYDPSQGASVCFPLADYKVEIQSAEMKLVKDNPSAGYLELSLRVLEGQLTGMAQADRLNIFHTNETPKLIAHRQLSAYCFAINRPYIQDTQQLIGGRLIATIGPQEDNPKYSEVKVVKCWDGSLPTKPPQGQPQGQQIVQPAPQAPASAPAWGSLPSQPPWNGQAPQMPAMPGQTAAAPPAPPVAPQWGNAPPPPAAPPAPAPSAMPPWLKQ